MQLRLPATFISRKNFKFFLKRNIFLSLLNNVIVFLSTGGSSGAAILIGLLIL